MMNYLLSILLAVLAGKEDDMKKKVKRLRKYGSVRICDPSGMRKTCVHPRQGIKIVLSPPHEKNTNVSEDACWKVSIRSTYLFLKEVQEDNKGHIVYYIDQKYDLTTWAEVSETFLGEIFVDLVDNTHPNKDECKYTGSSICVYHTPHDSRTSSKFLTVINPDQCTIKLEQQRTLEVVCYEPEWGDGFSAEDWKVSIEDFEVETQGVFLTEIYKHVNELHDRGHQRQCLGECVILPRHSPYLNSSLDTIWAPLWSAELREMKKPSRQFHFWFAFSKESAKKINALKTGNYVVARITLRGSALDSNSPYTIDNPKLVTSERELILMLAKHGRPVPVPLDDDMKFNRTNTLTNIYPGNSTIKRDFDSQLGLLTNPGSSEILDFYVGCEEYTVEIVRPKIYWLEEPDDAVWKLEIEHPNTVDECLDIVYLDSIDKLGICYQRFRIVPKSGKTGSAAGFMGVVKIVYPPKQYLHGGTRRLSIWTKKTNAIYQDYSPKHFKFGLGNYNKPKLATVNIEEIVCASLNDGANTRKLTEVYIDNCSDYNTGYYYSLPIVKKKDSSSMSARHIVGNPSLTDNTHAAGRSIMGCNTHNMMPTTTRDGVASIEPIVLHNPANLQEVTLLPEQDLIIQLMAPEEVLAKQEDREKCRGEMWAVNTLSIADIKPIVIKHRISHAGSERYRQEIVIKTDKHRMPQYRGRHCVGAICLECAATKRVVRIYVNKDMNTEKSYQPPQNIKFLKNVPSHESNHYCSLLAQDWQHGSGIVLKTDDVIYIRQPDEPDWNDWTVQFIQHSIPLHLWERMPIEVRDVVDRHQPWYSRDHPIFLKQTLLFRALSQCASTMLNKLLESIRDLTHVRYFPIATVAFESFKLGDAVSDKDGIINTCVKMRREFHVCVEIPESSQNVDSTPIPIFFPADGARIRLNKGEEFVIHLNRRESNHGGYYLWQCTSYASFIEYTSNTNHDSFKFRIKDIGSGVINFECNKETLSVQVVGLAALN